MELTPNEKKVIRRAAKIQVESFIRLGIGSHEIFEEFCQIECENPKEGKTLINEELVDRIQTFEEIQDIPEKLFALDRMNLMVMQLVVISYIPNTRFPKSKRKILRKLDIARNNKTDHLLN